jgi:ribosomal protein S18 acetylase RimI-like enzyme
MEDFDVVYDYIRKLWTYNTYDKETVKKIYREVLEKDSDFSFLLLDDEKPVGWCHGTIFNTFWLSGKTMYISSIITNQEQRGKGYGHKLMDRAVEIAKAGGCRAIVLDSGLPREAAHRFYEDYGFEKCALCFEYKLRG